jgi:capsular exopolysaccharide synthesis family protein
MARAAQHRASRTPPSVGEYVRAVWRRKIFVVLGLIAGLGLGLFVLPDMLTSQGSYQATQRLKVAKLVSDTIVREQPQFPTDNAKGGGNALQDVVLAAAVVDKLGSKADGLTAKDVVSNLAANPIPGSSFVDLSYTDKDEARAGLIVQEYARAWARARNATDARRLKAATASLDPQINALKKQVDELRAAAPSTQTQSAELSQAQSRLTALSNLRIEIDRQKTLLSTPTAVLGTPVIVQLSAPTSRVLILTLGLLIGLLAGVGLALLIEAARPKVLAAADVERATQLPVVATVPAAGMRGGLPVLRRSFSPAAEGYRRVAGTLERRGLGRDIRVLAVASADPGEGKSLLAANLAHLLSRQGHSVVLISGDLRRPRLDRIMGLAGQPGVADWLEHGSSDPGRWLRTISGNLMMLPAGSTQQNPGELITMRQLRQGLDPMANAGWIVLIDTPPALWSAEAMTLAAAADATLLVTRVRNSRWSAMEYLAEALRRDGVRAIGVVLVGTRRNLSSLGLRNGYGYGTGRNDATAAAGPEPPWSRPQPGQDAIGRGTSAEPVGNGHRLERLEPRGNSSLPDQTLPSSSPLPSTRTRRRGRA